MTTAPSVEPKADLKKVPEFALHPFCEYIPACTKQEFKELKEDIKTNGLQIPIKIYETKILDGRSRYNACLELEKEGHPVEFKKETFLGSAKEALAYVVSMNVKRRHLSASQRALIAARLVNSTVGGNHSVKLPNEITQGDVAKLAGVATKMVTDAKLVFDKSPELAAKVLNGELAVAKAADQIRKEENAGTGQSGNGASGDAPAFDVDNAVKVYDEAETRLVNALVALGNASNVGHAKEKVAKTAEHLSKAITELECMANLRREAAQKKAAA